MIPVIFERAAPCPRCGEHEFYSSNGKCKRCHRRRERERSASKLDIDPFLDLWKKAQRRAAEKMVPFTITVQDLEALWPADGRCPVLGIELKRGVGFVQDGSPTVDRLNNEWGYEVGNVAIISNRANRAKGGMKAQELEQIAKWMYSQGLS